MFLQTRPEPWEASRPRCRAPRPAALAAPLKFSLSKPCSSTKPLSARYHVQDPPLLLPPPHKSEISSKSCLTKRLTSVYSVSRPPRSLQGYLVPRLTAPLRRRSLTCCPTWAETSLLLRPPRLPLLPTLPTLHIFRASQVKRRFPNMFHQIKK